MITGQIINKGVKFMDKLYEQSETGCCRDSIPNHGRKRGIIQGKAVPQGSCEEYFTYPLNFDKIMVKNMEKIQAADALSPEPLMLSDEKSLWGADVYIAVSKEVPEPRWKRYPGLFLSKVFEGSYKNMGKWAKEMQGYVKSKVKNLKRCIFSIQHARNALNFTERIIRYIGTGLGIME